MLQGTCVIPLGEGVVAQSHKLSHPLHEPLFTATELALQGEALGLACVLPSVMDHRPGLHECI